VVIYALLSREKNRRKFTHFSVYIFQALKSASVKKMTNMRYACVTSQAALHLKIDAVTYILVLQVCPCQKDQEH